tara:strand:+ start:45 stop:956 length:912 start_codon:yes stop_codon:yes gene_type:complete
MGFYDIPNKRKIHNTKIFNTGGVIIFLFYLAVISLTELNYNIELIISIGFLIFVVGFVDDRMDLIPSIKILFIILASACLIFNGLIIESLGTYELIGVLNLGKFKIPFLLLAAGLLINSTNYIDGVDGLLLTFFISCLSYYIFLLEDKQTIDLIKLLLIPVILNLFLNMLPSKSNIKFFTGNSGSLFIGFFISFLTIELHNGFGIHPAYLIWPLWYPVYDFLFVSINRILKKKSILLSDNSHLHHHIFNYFNKSHFKTTMLFAFSNIVIIYLSFQISNYSKILSLFTFILGFLLYFTARYKFR